MKEISIRTATSKFSTWYNPISESSGRIALIILSRFQNTSDNLLMLASLLHKTFSHHGFRTMTYCHHLWEPECSAEGIHDNFQESLFHANTCLNWLQNQTILPEPCWLIGFGYGAWTSMQMLMRRPESEHFISISTPVGACDFSFLAPCPVGGLFIHGGQDKNFGKFEVSQLVKNLTLQKNLPLGLEIFPNANHHFSGYEKDLTKFLLEYIPEIQKKYQLQPVLLERESLFSEEDSLESTEEEYDEEDFIISSSIEVA
jgi:alpha/beta superfamily hydrolase